MKNMKRSVIILSAALLWSSILPAADFEVGDFCYNILSSEDFTVEVVKTVKDHAGFVSQLSIPESVEYNGEAYRVIAIGDRIFSECTSLTSVTIPGSVTTLGDSAFWNCTGLTALTIPENVVTIGNSVFSGCENLMSVIIGDSVAAIGNFAFFHCRSLTTITIPDKVVSLGNGAFSNCEGLQSVIFGESLASIGSEAFSECSGLKWITVYNSVPAELGSFIFESGVYSTCSLYVPADAKEQYAKTKTWKKFRTILPIEAAAYDFESGDFCYKILSSERLTVEVVKTARKYAGFVSLLSIPESVEYGGKKYGIATIGAGAFFNCTELTSVTIPENVTTIGERAFFNCKALQSIVLGDSISAIGSEAFSECSGLQSVTVHNSVPARSDATIFYGVEYANCTLYVPAGAVEAYQAAEGWNAFETIVPVEEPDAVTETKQDAEGITVYNLQGVLVLEADDAAALRTLPAGAYIVNGKTMIIAR